MWGDDGGVSGVGEAVGGRGMSIFDWLRQLFCWHKWYSVGIDQDTHQMIVCCEKCEKTMEIRP